MDDRMWPGLTILILDCIWANNVCLASIGASYSLKCSLALLHVTQYREKYMLQYDDPISGLRINFSDFISFSTACYNWSAVYTNAFYMKICMYHPYIYYVIYSQFLLFMHHKCGACSRSPQVNLDTSTTYCRKLVDLQTTLHQLHKCDCLFHWECSQ